MLFYVYNKQGYGPLFGARTENNFEASYKLQLTNSDERTKRKHCVQVLPFNNSSYTAFSPKNTQRTFFSFTPGDSATAGAKMSNFLPLKSMTRNLVTRPMTELM